MPRPKNRGHSFEPRMFSPRRKKLSGEDIQRISMKKGGTRGEEREGEERRGETRQSEAKRRRKERRRRAEHGAKRKGTTKDAAVPKATSQGRAPREKTERTMASLSLRWRHSNSPLAARILRRQLVTAFLPRRHMASRNNRLQQVAFQAVRPVLRTRPDHFFCNCFAVSSRGRGDDTLPAVVCPEISSRGSGPPRRGIPPGGPCALPSTRGAAAPRSPRRGSPAAARPKRRTAPARSR